MLNLAITIRALIDLGSRASRAHVRLIPEIYIESPQTVRVFSYLQLDHKIMAVQSVSSASADPIWNLIKVSLRFS